MADRRTPGTGANADQDPTLPEEPFAAMIDWYREMHRDLPWRRTRDPYPILVSEIMLQQTRVETVLGRYESFLERFPTVAALAAAPLDDVLAEWSGLGYYRRPRALHALARTVVDEHGGEIPDTLDALLALPGLGPYTAAAVGSIAFGIPALSVDGNVGRILCRIGAIEDDFRRAPVRRRLEALVTDAMREHDPGELNQAIMELGARVCTPRAPRCHQCPASSWCAAHALGIEELIPQRRRETVHAVTEHAAVIESDGRYLLLRGQRPSLVADMWEFPTLDSRLAARSSDRDEHQGDNGGSQEALRRYLGGLGFPVRLRARLGEIRHGMTNRRIRCRVYEGAIDENGLKSTHGAPSPERVVPSQGDGARGTAPDDHGSTGELVAEPDNEPLAERPPPEHGWFTPDQIADLPLAASARKTLAELLETPLRST